jgi:hypothetical protein
MVYKIMLRVDAEHTEMAGHTERPKHFRVFCCFRVFRVLY